MIDLNQFYFDAKLAENNNSSVLFTTDFYRSNFMESLYNWFQSVLSQYT